MIDKEQKYILMLLSDAINERDSKADDIDWNQLATYASRHGVLAIVFYQCRNFLPREIIKKYQNAYYQAIAMYHNRNTLLNDLKKRFDFLVVKGPAIAVYYPHKELRTMSDIDIVMEDRQPFVNYLRTIGFSVDCNSSNSDWHAKRGNVILELHEKLVQDDGTNHVEAATVFNNIGCDIINGELDRSMHFAYCIYHMYRHFANHGLVLRHFIDLSVLTRNDENICWLKVYEILEKIQLIDFAKTCFGLNQRWFKITPPFDCGYLDETFAEDAMVKIITGDIPGLNDSDDAVISIANNINKKNHSFVHAKATEVLRSLFRPYDNLRSMRGYSYLNFSKLLLPIAWTQRLIIFALQKNKRKKFYSLLNADSESAKKRVNWLKSWGL